jgi:uncharacterized protein (UPF0332 family)
MANRSRIEFRDCIKQGLLRKVIPSVDKAKKGVNKARVFLGQSKKAFTIGAYDSSLMTCYQAIFLSAKSVLLKDGYREKSHACVARYLEEKYASTGEIDIKWVELLDRYRDLRHDDEYNVFFFASIKDCEELVKFASEFIDEMEKIIIRKTR